MTTLYLRVWEGEETNWVTLTPADPRTTDSSCFDEGIATGFDIPASKTNKFLTDLQTLLGKYKQDVNEV